MESLKQKVANSEHVLAEGKHVVDEIDKTYRTQLDERNKLLIRIQTVVDTLLTDEQRISVVRCWENFKFVDLYLVHGFNPSIIGQLFYVF